MNNKGKLLIIEPQVSDDDYSRRIGIKSSDYNAPEGSLFITMKAFSTPDLLKVKAQIATELENRMDLDDVVEANLDNLRELIAGADGKTIATLIRQTLDRIDNVSADEKRAKTRLELLKDEMQKRMLQEGESEKKFAGLVSITYKPETVYSTTEDGWGAVYNGIYEQATKLHEEGKDVSEAFAILQKRFTSTTLNELVKQGEDLPVGVKSSEITKIKFKRN